jgi:DNA topoisomerase-1
MVQIGTADEEEKPLFASLLPEQSISTITFDEAMDLFKLPRKLGTFQEMEVEVNVGRYGPYIRFGKSFVSLDAGEGVFDVDLERAITLIKAKQQAEAPVATYEGLPVTKGKGRFGPFIKWNNIFINVPARFNFENLTQDEIVTLIEDKKKKEAEKVVRNWEEEGIRIEKARWGRHALIKGKTKVDLAKDVDPEKISLGEAKELLAARKPAKKTK